MVDELLTDIAPQQRESFRNDYLELAQLPGADCDLQAFLDRYLELVVRLYAAHAGVLWFRSSSGPRLTVKAALGYDKLGLQDEFVAPHEALLRFTLTRTNSFLVKPYSRVAARVAASNPSDSFVLLGPVDSHGDRIAIVELFLGPTPARGKTAADRNRYVLWLDHLLSFFREGLEQRFLGNLAPLQAALTNLDATRSEIEAFQEAIRISLEITLNGYADSNFGSLKNNQTFSRYVHELLDSNGLRVECPECKSAAILRCQAAGNSKTGAFLYDHYLDKGRTFHGGPTTFPRVKLVAKLPRRNRG